MKKNLFALLAIILAFLPASATSGNGDWIKVRKQAGTMPEKQLAGRAGLPVFKLENLDKTVYGFQLYNTLNEDAVGIVSFNLNAPENIRMLHTQEYSACAGAYANGKYYLYQYTPASSGSFPIALVSIDLATGKETEIADYSEMPSLFTDMAYDYSTGVMYALGVGTSGSILLTLNLSDGSYHQIGSLGSNFYTLAADYDGQLYGIEQNGILCKIDKINGTLTSVGFTGIVPKFVQSMDFDRSDGTLYWAACDKNERSYLATVDLHTGKAVPIGRLQNDSEICALHIPFTRPSGNAPARATELTVTPGADGTLSAAVTWKNPETDLNGAPLTELGTIGIYRNGILMKSIDHPTPGGNENYVDNTPLNGLCTYKILAENSNGTGLAEYRSVYIGEDIPLPVSNIRLQKRGDTDVKITWDAPRSGLNGGWINPLNIRYKITRMPDNKILTNSIAENTYEDNSVVTLKSYSYKIQPINPQGSGSETISENMYLGPSLNLPYLCNFDMQDEFELWTVIDNNHDRCTWELSKYADGVSGAEYTYSSVNDADDWFISAPVRMAAGKSYKLSFSVRAGMSKYPEKMNVYIGKGSNIASQNKLLAEYDITSESRTKKTIIIDGLESGDYNIGFYACSKAKMFQFHLTNIALKENNEGTISGKITTDGAPTPDVKVELEGSSYQTMTDHEGAYSIEEINPDDYTLVLSRKGYETYRTSIHVGALQNLTKNIELPLLKKYLVTGKLVDSFGNAVDNAEITLNGYENYSVYSVKNGSFSIEAYKADGYRLTVRKTGFNPLKKEINVRDGELNLGDMTLSEKILPPTAVKARSTIASAQISWEAPKDELLTFRYDDGIQVGEMGIRNGSNKSVMGTVFRNPMSLTGMSWFTTDTEESHSKINLFVFELDKESNPTNRIIYSAENVPVTDGEWMDYVFPEIIEAPQGVMLAVSYEGFVSIATDAGASTGYPFIEKTHCYSPDYSNGNFTYIEGNGTRNNFFIRAQGYSLGKQHPEKAKSISPEEPAANTYSLWRFTQGEEKNESDWTLLTASPVDALSFTDRDSWSELPDGIYGYAVKAKYTNGEYSDAALSNLVDKGLSATVTIPVKTNTPENEAAGAIVTLTEADGGHSYTATVGSEGQAKLQNVWKGIYNLNIELKGFTPVSQDGLDFSVSDSYTTDTYTLTEIIETPFNLELLTTETESERILNWNVTPNITDDFESHADFTINSPGETGWSYIDGDQSKTYSLSNSFPGVGEAMAYVVFNPSATDPVMDAENYPDIQAHSGTKFLACITATTPPNNDLIISPELNFPKDFTFRFFAKTYKNYGLEKMKVGYSIKGKELNDFIWLTESPVEVPQEAWTEFTYTIPKKAKYVTVACISNDIYVFMLDDLFVGYQDEDGQTLQKSRAKSSYEVFLDGKKVAGTNETTYRFTELSGGKHTAGVRSAYTSGNSEIVSIDFTVNINGIDTHIQPNMTIYPNPMKDRLHVTGNYTSVQILSIGGNKVITSPVQSNGIDVSYLEKGVYIVCIITPEGTRQFKVMKE